MSKLKKLKTFLNTRSKNAHNLLVKTIEKTSFWKDESTLAFPLFCSFSQYCWFFVACVLPFCYKKGLKMTKRESCWVKSFCTVWGEVTPRSMPFLQNSTFFSFFCKTPSVFTCMSLSKKRVDRKNTFYSLIPMSCKINPCSFISLYLDQYQIKIFLKNDNGLSLS